VKEIGSMTNSTRAQEQSDIARFWLASPSVIWTAAARQVVEARGLGSSTDMIVADTLVRTVFAQS
jgi:hypothetical protein